MRLTTEQRRMLEGELGFGPQVAMRIIVRVAEAYDAASLVPIVQAHIDGCCLSVTGQAGLEFAELLAANGARVRVPSTLNCTARDITRWEEFRIPAGHAAASARMEAAYLAMGCVPTWTCAPYQHGIIPRMGEMIAWAESNAIAFANSVIGARTARHGDFIDIAAAITGFAPEMGLYLPQQRFAGIEVRFEDLSPPPEQRDAAAAVAGYITGRVAGGHVPVITGLWPDITADELKAFSAAAASSGDIGLFHVPEVTPEAPTLEAAGGGGAPDRVVTVSNGDVEQARWSLTGASRGVGLVAVGCPHASYPELESSLRLLRGRRVSPGVELWIQTSQTVRRWGEMTGVVGELGRLGASVMTDSCVLGWPLDNWGFGSIMTNSGKLAHYCRPQTGAEPVFGSLRDCIEAAVSGRVTTE